jgi:hypothetical protein
MPHGPDGYYVCVSCRLGYTRRDDWCIPSPELIKNGRLVSHLLETAQQLNLYRRDDAAASQPAENNNNQVQQSAAPALSPSAIVGIAIIGAMFL